MIKKIIFAALLAGLIALANAQSRPLPFGNYFDSCFRVEWLTPTSMSAYCQKISRNPEVPGRYVYSVLEVLKNGQRCEYVENIDGVLTCSGGFGF